MPKLLTIQQAAREAQVAAQSIYLAIRKGRLKGHRIMGRWMVHVDDLAVYTASRQAREKSKEVKP